MKFYTVLMSSILFTMSFVLQGQVEVSLVEDQNSHSFAAMTTDELPDATSYNRKVSFSTGDHMLVEYIATHLKYPKIAKENCLEGTAVVRFKVSAKGKIMDPKIIQSVHSVIDAKIIELIKNMPDWNPRIYNGRKVASVVELPFEFGLR